MWTSWKLSLWPANTSVYWKNFEHFANAQLKPDNTFQCWGKEIRFDCLQEQLLAPDTNFVLPCAEVPTINCPLWKWNHNDHWTPPNCPFLWTVKLEVGLPTWTGKIPMEFKSDIFIVSFLVSHRICAPWLCKTNVVFEKSDAMFDLQSIL